MGLPDLYPAQVGSPYTTLAVAYTTGESTMTLVDATKLPDAPNIVCLAGDVAGEFTYSGKDGNILQGVVALPGTPVATTWHVGAFAFRGISAYDLNALADYVTRGPIAVTVDDLQYPLYIAHRGGAHLWPENTMYAIEGALALGCQAIEIDVRMLADGALAVIHNATIDSMSSLTGNVADQTAMNWRSIPIDCSSWFGTAPFPDTTPLLVEDILRKFGGKVVFFFDVKDVAAIQPLTDLIVRYGLERSCVVIAASLAALAIPHTAGIPIAVIGDAVDPIAAASAGVQWCDMSANVTESYVSSMVAAGIKPLVYTLNRHSERDFWLARGVAGFFSDDPIYMSGTHRKLASDPFGTGTYYHGHLTTRHLPPGGGFGDTFTRGSFTSGRWGFPNTSTTVMFYDTLQGWACPIVDPSYRIAATVTFDAINDNGRWASIGFGWTDDRLSPESGGGINGYRVLVRANGNVDLYKYVHGTATKLGSTPTAPIHTGGSATIQIDVSPTEIVVTRTDVVDATATYADTTHRGPYISLGVAVGKVNFTAGVGATFSDVSVTPIA
jgi:glycerophosphoryl diester phosphodiesterase